MKDYLSLFSLKNKVAFVTGGSGLIGSEVSKALACAGAHTIILDMDIEKTKSIEAEIKTSNYLVSTEAFDITKLEKMGDSIQELVKKYKGIDIWVNLAYPRTKDWGKSMEDIPVESLRKNVEMHMNSYIWASRVVALEMRKRKIRGSIINLGSTYGVLGNDFTIYEGTNISHPMEYSAIKGGIINFSRYLASYFGKSGIRVNTVCPGGILDNQDNQFVKQYENKVPLGRMGKAEDVAGAVLYLASEASSYVTGSTFMIDGGWTII